MLNTHLHRPPTTPTTGVRDECDLLTSENTKTNQREYTLQYILYSSGSQPVVHVPLVVLEPPSGGIQICFNIMVVLGDFSEVVLGLKKVENHCSIVYTLSL